jgi:hypothetical protein
MSLRACPSGKITYASASLADDALIDLWSRNEYNPASAPIAVYQCDDCGLFHFTSKGAMSDALSKAISSGKIKKLREAYRWEEKFKKR